MPRLGEWASAIAAALQQREARRDGMADGTGTRRREQAPGEEPATQCRKIDALERRQGGRVAYGAMLR
jgi:hypothetical protein